MMEYGVGKGRVDIDGPLVTPLTDQARKSLDMFGLEMNEASRGKFYASGWWRDSTVAADFERVWRINKNKTAVVTNRTESGRREAVSFAELAFRVDRIAAYLIEAGVTAEDVISVQLPNWWQFNAVALAALKIGAVLNPIIPAHRDRDVRFMMGLISSTVCFFPSIYRKFDYKEMMSKIARDLPSLKQLVVVDGERCHGFVSFEEDILGIPWESGNKVRLQEGKPDPDKIAEILFTSGTTGEPKGAGHTNNTMFSRARSVYQILGLTQDDIVFMPSALGHSTGFIYGCITPAMLGMKAVYQDIWDPERALEIIERERVTWSFISTTFVVDLIRAQRKAKRDISSLRYLVSGGATIPPAVVREAGEVLSARLMAVWGMTENGAVTCTRPEEPPFAASESDGTASPWMEMKIVDLGTREDAGYNAIGELKVRGASQMLGYVSRPSFNKVSFDDQSWFSTGDLARIDHTGHLRVTGRIKDVIIRGGENVPVTEIESLLYGHPAILAVAIVGYADDRLGERACAVVVPISGVELRLSDLTSFLEAAGVAKVYWPERLVIVDSLPYNSAGKVKKFKLQLMLAEDQVLDEGN